MGSLDFIEAISKNISNSSLVFIPIALCVCAGFAVLDGSKMLKLGAPVSIRDLKKLNWSGFKGLSFTERVQILVSCVWTVPLIFLVSIALAIYTVIWSFGTLLSPIIDSVIEHPEDTLARENREKYGMVDVKVLDADKVDLPHEEYDIYILNTVLMGVTGKLGEYAKQNSIYHSGVGFISKDGSQEVAIDLAVHAGFTNCIIPDVDLGLTLFPPGFRSHVQFLNATDISFYKELDRSYWKEYSCVGSCRVEKIRDFLRFTQSYRETHRYNLVGVGVAVGDSFRPLIEPDTCISFVDRTMTFFKEDINLAKLSLVKEAIYYWVVEKESDFKMLEHQTSVVTEFFRNMKQDITSAIVNSDGGFSPQHVFLSVMKKLTERLPSVSWYADIPVKGQVFYQLNYPTMRHRFQEWTVLSQHEN